MALCPTYTQLFAQSNVNRRLFIKMDDRAAPQNWSQNILIAPWWLAVVYVLKPTSSMLANGTLAKLINWSTHQIILFFQRWFPSLSQFLAHGLYVEFFMFWISWVLINYLMLLNKVKHHHWQLRLTIGWVLAGPRHCGSQPRSLLRALWLHMTSKGQDGGSCIRDILASIF